MGREWEYTYHTGLNGWNVEQKSSIAAAPLLIDRPNERIKWYVNISPKGYHSLWITMNFIDFELWVCERMDKRKQEMERVCVRMGDWVYI